MSDIRLTATEKRAILRAYGAGEKTDAIAAHFGIHRTYPAHLARRRGMPRRPARRLGCRVGPAR
jgi:hypothetical protein